MIPFFVRAEGVYRWVDKNGQVHFGDHPPAGVQAEVVLAPLPLGSAEAQHQLRDYVRTLEVQEAERAKDEERKRAEQALQDARKADCETSRVRRERLEKPRQLEYQPDGSARRLTEEERRARIADTEERIADVCASTP
ncbi:MAG: DUF4124 domain-containing protein [Gammaproteobacteria bacterium]